MIIEWFFSEMKKKQIEERKSRYQKKPDDDRNFYL